MPKYLSACTLLGIDCPPFINLSTDDAGDVEINVRGAMDPVTGHSPWAGLTVPRIAAIELLEQALAGLKSAG